MNLNRNRGNQNGDFGRTYPDSLFFIPEFPDFEGGWKLGYPDQEFPIGIGLCKRVFVAAGNVCITNRQVCF